MIDCFMRRLYSASYASEVHIVVTTQSSIERVLRANVGMEIIDLPYTVPSSWPDVKGGIMLMSNGTVGVAEDPAKSRVRGRRGSQEFLLFRFRNALR